MIRVEDGLFTLETAHTGYYMAQRGTLVENLHYGAKIRIKAPGPLLEKQAVRYGNDVAYKKAVKPLSLDHLCLELSPVNKGDYRAPALALSMPGGARTADFAFACARVLPVAAPPAGLPGAWGGEESLALDFTTPEGVGVTLLYTVYPACDVITRRLCVRNGAAAPVTLHRALSYQLDLPGHDYTLSTFTGAWARECHETRVPLAQGSHLFGSTTGASSEYWNPFFMLCEKGATEFTGGVYGFNLVYSGSHAARVEVAPWGRTRVSAGIQPDGFSWTLAPGESFETPEAVLTFSADGKNGMSANMHAFVRAHIVRGPWAARERPVLFNNWEGTYFDFNERRLLRLAREAAALGAELFVLDDGWFGARDDDTKGLGDYTVNRRKLPGGLDGLAEKIRAMGLSFGLWFEPEMTNPDSDLYRAHPDWIVQTPGIEPGEGRNQYTLDLCRPEVQEYIIGQVNATLASASIEYVKWDMNRPIADNYSPALDEQGRFAHSYMLGLYRVLEAVTAANPNVLFEGCASGGSRFDLGMLCYMQQIWTSDDTDAYERQFIQTGASYGYPPSVMGCHVSASPNHQTARTSPIETRFNVAAFGVLGYELDLTCLTPAEHRAVAAQIAFYKAHRALLQYGRFLRLVSPFDEKRCVWMAVSQDGREALAGEFTHLLVPNAETPPLRFAALRPDVLYRVENRPQAVDVRAFGGLVNHILPVKVNAGGLLMHAVADRYMMPCETERYTAWGDLLMYAGIKRMQGFSGTGYNKNVRLMTDLASRLYHLCAVEEQSGAQEEEER